MNIPHIPTTSNPQNKGESFYLNLYVMMLYLIFGRCLLMYLPIFLPLSLVFKNITRLNNTYAGTLLKIQKTCCMLHSFFLFPLT